MSALDALPLQEPAVVAPTNPESAGRPLTFAEGLTEGERRLRWFIVGWITLSTILNLIDKNTLALLAPTLKIKLGIGEAAYGHIIMAFQFSYAIMYMVAGRFVDQVGEKVGMTACVAWWSVATMLHSLARGVMSLGIFRFLLGVGEPGNYPAALRASARWFSKEERGLPIAIWSSGSAVGNLLAVWIVTSLAIHFGWQAAFFVPGFFGMLWVLVWLLTYRVPSGAAACEADLAPATAGVSPAMVRGRDALHDGRDARPSPTLSDSGGFVQLLKDRRLWAIVLARFLTDPVWVFYQNWTPKFLAAAWNFDLAKMRLYAWIPFLFGTLGGVCGGVVSDWLIRRGLEPAKARKRLLFATGAIAPIGMLTGFVPSAGVSIALIALMAFVCYVWFIDTAALMSDVFPPRLVGSVLGLAAGMGQFAGIGMAWLAGHLLERNQSYTPLFIVAGSGHLLASLVLYFMLKEKSNGATGYS